MNDRLVEGGLIGANVSQRFILPVSSLLQLRGIQLNHDALTVAVSSARVAQLESFFEHEEPVPVVDDRILFWRNTLFGRFRSGTIGLEHYFEIRSSDRLDVRFFRTEYRDLASGQPLGAVDGIDVDVTKRNDDAISGITADSSHELRTPLAIVRGIGEAAVAERRTPAEYEEAIGSMLEEIDRMSNLVNTLLRLSYGDAGTIHLSRESVDVGALTEEVAASLGILAEERNQTLTFHITLGIDALVDRLVLREAITNVLDNAIKYSPDGATILIRLEHLDNRAVLTIADQGPGIPSEDRGRIFDRFFRVDEARSRDHGGAGLGLAIAKWAVEIHAGQITVQDRPGGGSEFRILLPLARRVESTDDENHESHASAQF